MIRRAIRFSCGVVLAWAAWAQTQSGVQAPAPARRTVFSVRYVAQDAVYIDAGSAEGIAPGMIVEISRLAAGAAAIDRQASGDGRGDGRGDQLRRSARSSRRRSTPAKADEARLSDRR